MNRNTRSRLKELTTARKKSGQRTTGFKARKRDYPKFDHRPDLAFTSGYDHRGQYVGKPWSQCW